MKRSMRWRSIANRAQLWRMPDDFWQWVRSDFSPQPPTVVKRAVLRRSAIPGAAWIETGTFRGTTTKWLATFSPQVISLEPQRELYHEAKRRLSAFTNIELLNENSEVGLGSAIQKLSGTSVNFWLDGHYSDGPTFRGGRDTPILMELKTIQSAIRSGKIQSLTVFVDDVRLFVAEYRHVPADETRSGYPSLGLLTDWARENNLRWTIENDIFIAQSELKPNYG